MKVLLLQDPDEVRERVVFSLESRFNAQVHEAKTVTRALEVIREAQGLDLLFSNNDHLAHLGATDADRATDIVELGAARFGISVFVVTGLFDAERFGQNGLVLCWLRKFSLKGNLSEL